MAKAVEELRGLDAVAWRWTMTLIAGRDVAEARRFRWGRLSFQPSRSIHRSDKSMVMCVLCSWERSRE